MEALGKHLYGIGRGHRDLVYLTVSTGIGGGVIVNGELLLGQGRFAGEIGHMTIDRNGPLCTCGNVGCLEALASGTSIAKQAAQRIQGGKVSRISQLVQDRLELIAAEVVAQAAIEGDALAQEVMEGATIALGWGVVSLLHIFDPEIIILGGGVIQQLHQMFSLLYRVVRQNTMSHRQREVPVVPTSFGDKITLAGAAALFFRAAERGFSPGVGTTV